MEKIKLKNKLNGSSVSNNYTDNVIESDSKSIILTVSSITKFIIMLIA